MQHRTLSVPRGEHVSGQANDSCPPPPQGLAPAQTCTTRGPCSPNPCQTAGPPNTASPNLGRRSHAPQLPPHPPPTHPTPFPPLLPGAGGTQQHSTQQAPKAARRARDLPAAGRMQRPCTAGPPTAPLPYQQVERRVDRNPPAAQHTQQSGVGLFGKCSRKGAEEEKKGRRVGKQAGAGGGGREVQVRSSRAVGWGGLGGRARRGASYAAAVLRPACKSQAGA